MSGEAPATTHELIDALLDLARGADLMDTPALTRELERLLPHLDMLEAATGLLKCAAALDMADLCHVERADMEATLDEPDLDVTPFLDEAAERVEVWREEARACATVLASLEVMASRTTHPAA